MEILSKLAIAFFVLYLTSAPVRAQQPFYTDDSDVTDRHKLHFQLSNEFDLLQRISLPAKAQNLAVFELDYGLVRSVEIGVDVPWLRIQSAAPVTPRIASGIGDTSFHIKYNFLTEREDSRRPALGISMIVQAPTGDVSRQLGTGLTDYYVNGIIQKSLPKDTKIRLNGGIVFAGNTVNGALGLRAARGKVFTGGGSLVRQFTERLDLGFELTGAVTGNFDLSKGQLQGLIGGNYAITKKLTFDFGLVAGHFAASPRAGAQLGLSLDF